MALSATNLLGLSIQYRPTNTGLPIPADTVWPILQQRFGFVSGGKNRTHPLRWPSVLPQIWKPHCAKTGVFDIPYRH